MGNHRAERAPKRRTSATAAPVSGKRRASTPPRRSVVRLPSLPLVAGVAVLGAIAAKTLAPMSGALPAWAPLAVAGVVLVALGATWEARLEDLRRARAFVGSMR